LTEEFDPEKAAMFPRKTIAFLFLDGMLPIHRAQTKKPTPLEEIRIMSLNMAVMLQETAKRLPQGTAIIFGDRKQTYGELDAAANRVANALTALGVGRGQKVMVMLPNIPEFVACYYGILKTGATVVPINVLNKAREIEFLLTDSESVACIACTEFLPEVQEAFRRVSTCKHLVVVPFVKPASSLEGQGLYRYEALIPGASPTFDMVQTNGDDTAAIVYTSGTTGKPKGAELTHFSQFFMCRVLPDLTEDFSRPDDVALVVLPLFHSYGQTCIMSTAIAMGTAFSLVPRYDPGTTLQLLEKHQITTFAAVPTMFVQVLHHPDRKKYNLSRLRRCVSGGAPIAVETLESWKREYNFDIREGYGLTETSPIATFSLGAVQPRYGSCGKPIYGVEVKIVDDNDRDVPIGREGEVVIRGVNVMKGYYKNPEATAAVMKGGWFHSGDIGRMDADGYLYIVDRKKDMIIRGGYNVYPREIEEQLYEHPAVQECAVVGVKHPELGEEVKAVLFLKSGASVTPDEIRAYCKDRMAAYKYPRLVEIRGEQLPKGPTGKILKRELTS
jgi:long-chain acyl-CoA synthetase